ncbi:hypothetical protein AB4Z55_27495 [Gordonia sp. ABKF26]|uniref:hypothetical protein n=1 Tax=Gordonia sp. ABKF26 TaxID=3238687 RepID=UPI0034E5DD41
MLALLHITGTAGPMHVADYSLGFVGLGVVAAMIMFGVAAPYSMTAHLSKGVVVSARTMREQLVHNPLIRSRLLAILMPVLLRIAGITHPYWLGLAATILTDVVIT